MLILESLEFYNIGRFVDPQIINFTRLPTITQIEGKNNNTGGSSGSAKSTALKALDFLFGVNNVPTNVLQSRLTDESIFVRGKFRHDGKPLRIERGKKLLIDQDGEVTTGSSKITEDLLDQIIGMPRELFRKTMHKRQGEGGFFLEMTPAKVHEFLTSCLGLKAEQAKIVKIDELLSSLNDKKISLSTSLGSHKAALEATYNAINNHPVPVLDAIEPLDYLEKEYENKSTIRKTISNRHFSDVSEFEDKIKTIEKIELQRQNSIKSQISEFKNLMNKLNTEEMIRQREVERNMSDIRFEKSQAVLAVNVGKRERDNALKSLEELKKIRLSTCPTCDQNWINEASKAKEEEISNRLKGSRRYVIEGQEAEKRMLDYESRMEQLRKDLEPRITPEMTELDSKIASLLRQINNEELKKYDDCCRIINRELILFRERNLAELQNAQDLEQSARLRYESAKQKLASFEENKRKSEEFKVKMATFIGHYSEQINSILSELDSIVQQIENAEEAKKAIKSYLSCSFDDALDSIGTNATNILRSIPNMATATISLEGIKENADGKIKEEVNAVISMDGEIGIPIKSLSGGEKSSTDLAIDLAAVNFIEEKTGQGINVMGLDEFTNGLDTICILEVMEMLRNSKLDKKILLVEHNPIVSKTIESKITVERNGLKSRIIQN